MVLTTVLATLAWEKLEDHCVFSPKHRYKSLSFTSDFFVKEWRLDTSENGGAGNSTFLAFIKTVIKYREIQKKKTAVYCYLFLDKFRFSGYYFSPVLHALSLFTDNENFGDFFLKFKIKNISYKGKVSINKLTC